MDDFLEDVLEYAKRGWHIFPLHTKSKMPAISREKGGHGFKDATNDLGRLERWWKKNPDHNIGLATGASDLYVVDVDGERGEESLRNLEDEHGELPETLVCRTGQGFHHYFQLPEGRPGNSSSKLGLGIDTRGEGGYVILPPSVHPLTLQPYEWVNDLPVAQLPAWIVKSFEKLEWIPPMYTPSAYIVNIHPYVRRVWEGVQSDLQSAIQGRRNEELNIAAVKMGNWIASSSIDQDRVEQELAEIARNLGLSEHEIEATIQSGIGAGLKSPKYPPPPEPYGFENKHQQAARQVEGTIAIQRGSSFGRKEVKYMWNKRVPLGKLTILAGPSSIGKSFVSLALAAHVTAGAKLIDSPTRIDGECLFASYEDDIEDTIGPRADALGVDMDRCHFIQGVDTEHGKRPFGPQDVPRIIDYLKACPQIKLIVIDPLGSFLGSGTDGNSETEARGVLGTLVDTAAQTDTAVIIIAHFNKSTESEDPLHRVAGSQGITALPRSVLTVSWGENKERLVKHIKSSTSAECSTIGYGFDTGQFDWTRVVRSPAEAEQWLRTTLANGQVELTEIFRAAILFGLHDDELEAARDAVNPDILGEEHGTRFWRLSGH